MKECYEIMKYNRLKDFVTYEGMLRNYEVQQSDRSKSSNEWVEFV